MNVLRASVLVVAVGAGTSAWIVAQSLDRGDPAPLVVETAAETEQVLVAARDIRPGRAIAAADLSWSTWPKDALSSSLLLQAANPQAASELVGAVARTGLAAGEPIRPTKLVAGDRGGYMSAVLPSGMRAVSMRTSPQTGAGGFILPNDRVDVILIRPDTATLDPATEGARRYASERILENVRVLAIDQTIEDQDGRSVVVGNVATLELTPHQVDVLTRGQQLGELSLALRSVLDGGPQLEEEPVRARSRSVSVVKFGVTRRIGVN